MVDGFDVDFIFISMNVIDFFASHFAAFLFLTNEFNSFCPVYMKFTEKPKKQTNSITFQSQYQSEWKNNKNSESVKFYIHIIYIIYLSIYL